MDSKTINMTVNGVHQTITVAVGDSLLEVIRNRLHLTGTKSGCGVGECGACTVLVDGEAVDSCLFLAVWADGRQIRTIEGEAAGGQLSKVQTAFITEGAVQCGFCTPGFIMSVTALAEHNCECDRGGLRKELAGHMCRCTGYVNILNAAEKALDK